MDKKGFTIIELIVVIAIIAILAAVVMVNVTQYINKSKESATRATVDQIAKALLMYKSQYGCFPSPINCSGTGIELNCECCPTNGNCDGGFDTWGNIATLLANVGLIGNGQLLYKDSWDNNYYYWAEWPDGSGTTCTAIFSMGPDQTDNGGGTCPYYNSENDIGVDIESHN